MRGLSKELVETTHGLRGRGVTKVGQVVLGYEAARKGGHVKRGMSLADLASPSKVPKTDCVGTASSLREDVEVSSLREDVEASRPGPRHGVRPKYSTSAEAHYVWNCHVSTRLAFSHEVRRGTMTLDGTDVGNGKVVTCVVGDMDRDLHSWAPPADPTSTDTLLLYCY